MDDAQQPPATSFCCNLRRWVEVMDEYVSGSVGFKYYTTLPTDALMVFRDAVVEIQNFGVHKSKVRMLELGSRIRGVLAKRGFKSVAAPENAAPGVVVSYTPMPGMVGRFKSEGLQLAGGVPFKLGEDAPPFNVDARKQTFRVGLFGLDKLKDVDLTVTRFEEALDRVIAASRL